MKSSWITRCCFLALLLAVSGTSGLMAQVNDGNASSVDASLVASASDVQLFGSSEQFTAADENGRYVFLIEFTEPGLIEMHRQTRQTGERFNFLASDIQSEASLMESRQGAYIQGMSSLLSRELEVSHRYLVTHSGIAARLTMQEARLLQSMPEVASVARERLYHLETFAGPEFIGAGSVWDGSTTPDGGEYRGEGMVAGVLDSGILPNHPSFANDAACGHGVGDNPDKLISFVDCGATDGAGYCNGGTPVDTNGHGTHVAGTVAGNLIGPEVTPAPNPPQGNTISGVAYCAHIRNYKVCPGTSCPQAAIQAGMNSLLIDGDVDTMNFSISGGTSPWLDNDRRKLDLVDAGVYVNASSGNTSAGVPNPIGTVNHRGPWVTAVAASTRPGGAPPGLVSVTGPGTPPSNLVDVTVTPGSDAPANPGVINAEIRFDPNQPAGADGCDSFPADFFDGTAALIERGTCPFTDKINNAFAAGAILVIIRNNVTGDFGISTPGQANIPAYAMLQGPGNALRDFIAGNPGATVRFEPLPGGDELAGFSLRGPTPSPLQNLQKPDITAPGVSIYAADVGAAGYGNKSGTSMSGPHVSGAAVLIRQMQPDWSPIEVGSAMRLTAKKTGTKPGGTSAWDWDDVGSGRIELTRAGLAGMVMNETFANFMAADPASGGDVRTLNLPAVRDLSCTPNCTFTRTLRNTLDMPTSYTVDSEVISGTFGVEVSPSSFSFTGDTSETQTVTITVSPVGTIPLSFGTIDFIEDAGLSPDLHFTVAVAGQGDGGTDPEGVTGFDFEGTVSGITGDPEGVWASDLQMNITGPSGSSFIVGGFSTGNPPWDFDGAGSDTDGTYNSSHPTAFLNGTDLDGDWTVTFTHTYAPGAAMTWDPLTIELTGPARNVLGVLNLPPFTINGGATTSFTIPVGDGPPPGDDPTISVNPEALSYIVEQGESLSQNLTIANIGEGVLEWEITDAGPTSVVLRAGGQVTIPSTTVPANVSGLSSSSAAVVSTGASSAGFNPLGDGTTISHSNSNTVAAGNTVACAQDGGVFTTENYYYRTFTLADFGIDSDFNVNEVTFGIENLDSTQPITVNLYTLDGAFNLNNLTLIGSETESLPSQQLTLVTVPVEGQVEAGGTLVVEITSPDLSGVAAFFPGSNSAGETAPSYIRAPGCGIATPTTYAGIGFPQVQLIMSVTGTTEAVACELPSWVDVAPGSGAVNAGESDTVSVTLDTDGLALGNYEANLCVTSNDPASSLVIVPVSLDVVDFAPTPEADISPLSFSFVTEAGTSAGDDLLIGNTGSGNLNWQIDTAEAADFAANFRPSVNPPRGSDSQAVLSSMDGSVEVFADELAGLVRPMGTIDPTLSVDGMTSGAGFGSGNAFNSTLTLPIGVGNEVIGIGWEVTIATNGASWLSESGVAIVPTSADTTGLFLRPGAANQEPGNASYSSEGVLMFGDVEIAPIPASVDGEIYMEWYETFSDGANPDAEWSDSASPVELPPGLRLICTDQAACDAAVSGGPGPMPEACDSPSEISWLSVSASGGSTAPGAVSTVGVVANAAGLAVGNYEALLCVRTNDSAAELVEIPVSLTVEEPTLPPEIAVDPTSISASVVSGDSDTVALDISNLGSLDLEWSLVTTRNVVNNNVVAARGGASGNPALASDFLFDGGGSLSFTPGYGVSGTFDCSDAEGLVILDDNTIENGYSGNAAVVSSLRFVQRYQPAEAGLLGTVCVNFLSLGPNSLSFDLVVFDADGPDGRPGTQLGSVPATISGLATGLPPGGVPAASNWAAVDLSGLGIVVESGSVYVGVAYAPTDPNVFISSDQSPATPLATGYWWNNNENDWITIATSWPDYRAILVRPQFLDAFNCDDPTTVPWLSVNPTSGTTAGGATSTVDVTLDASDLSGGTYEAALCVISNDPENPVVTVPVTLEVEFTADVGFLEGTVQSAGYCSANPFPAEGALVSAEGSNGGVFTTNAAADGSYSLVISDMESPVSITFSAPDHFSETVAGVVIEGGETTVVDADLVLQAACASVDPGSFSFSGSGADVLNIGNFGAGAELDWSLVTEIPDASQRASLLLLSEDFEGSFPPSGWTTVDDTGECPWLTSDDYGLFGWTGTARGAAVDSDDCGSGVTADASMVSPAIDLSASLNTSVSFDVAYRHLGSSALTLDASVDGSTWTNIETWSANFAYPDAASLPVSFDLSAFDGESEVYLRWRYTSGWDWWAFVDNVEVTGDATCYDPMVDTWLSVNPASGSVMVDESDAVDLVVDANGLSGTFNTSLCITTNDEEAPLFVVPVQLQILSDEIFQDRFED